MNELEKAIKLRESGKVEEAKKIIGELLNEHSDNPQVNYQYAWCCDILSLEKEAVSYYEKAIKKGLSGEERKEAYIGLGSTYRTIGEYKKSEMILLDGIKEFDDNALKVFLSMTYYNLGKHQEAMKILLNLIANTSDDTEIKNYKKAILYYSNKLDKLW